MQIGTLETAEKDISIRSNGTEYSNVLLKGDDDALDNYRMMFTIQGAAKGREGRHRHNFDQVRLPLEGDFVYGKDQVAKPGTLTYFPECAYYGPQFREEGSVMVTCQFGGPTGNGYQSSQARQRAFEEMSKRGKFENAVFKWTDAEGKRHNQDSSEALWEHIAGRKMIYPEPRYDGAILMHSDNYAWLDEAPGVAYRHLGTFSEREIKIGMIRVAKGATLQLAVEPAPLATFLKTGSVSIDGKTYAARTAFGFKKNETAPPIKAVEDSEFFFVKMPTF